MILIVVVLSIVVLDKLSYVVYPYCILVVTRFAHAFEEYAAMLQKIKISVSITQIVITYRQINAPEKIRTMQQCSKKTLTKAF